MAPGPCAAALCLLGFDVEVFPQRHMPNGLASANGEHQRHHVGIKACETREKLTRMFQAVHRGGTKVVPCRRPVEPSRPTYRIASPAQSLSTGKVTNRNIFWQGLDGGSGYESELLEHWWPEQVFEGLQTLVFLEQSGC